jgi:hypothetical protein
VQVVVYGVNKTSVAAALSCAMPALKILVNAPLVCMAGSSSPCPASLAQLDANPRGRPVLGNINITPVVYDGLKGLNSVVAARWPSGLIRGDTYAFSATQLAGLRRLSLPCEPHDPKFLGWWCEDACLTKMPQLEHLSIRMAEHRELPSWLHEELPAAVAAITSLKSFWVSSSVCDRLHSADTRVPKWWMAVCVLPALSEVHFVRPWNAAYVAAPTRERNMTAFSTEVAAERLRRQLPPLHMHTHADSRRPAAPLPAGGVDEILGVFGRDQFRAW